MHVSVRECKKSSSRWRTEEMSAFSVCFCPAHPFPAELHFFPQTKLHFSRPCLSVPRWRAQRTRAPAIRLDPQCTSCQTSRFLSFLIGTLRPLGTFPAHWELLPMSVLGQHVSYTSCEHCEMGWSVFPDNWSHWILNFPLSEAPSVVAESSACCFPSPSVQHHKYMSLLWSTTNGKPLEIVKQKLLQQSIVLGWKLLR